MPRHYRGCFDRLSRAARRLAVGASVLCVALAGHILVAEARQMLKAGEEEAIKPTQTSQWTKVDVQGKFALLMPPDMKEKKVAGKDSLVKQYGNDALEIMADYGKFSGPPDGDKNDAKYNKTSVNVDGKEGLLVTYQEANTARPYIAAVHFPDVSGDKRVKLTVLARCKDAKAQELAKQILQAITFPKTDPPAGK